MDRNLRATQVARLLLLFSIWAHCIWWSKTCIKFCRQCFITVTDFVIIIYWYVFCISNRDTISTLCKLILFSFAIISPVRIYICLKTVLWTSTIQWRIQRLGKELREHFIRKTFRVSSFRIFKNKSRDSSDLSNIVIHFKNINCCFSNKSLFWFIEEVV